MQRPQPTRPQRSPQRPPPRIQVDLTAAPTLRHGLNEVGDLGNRGQTRPTPVNTPGAAMLGGQRVDELQPTPTLRRKIGPDARPRQPPLPRPTVEDLRDDLRPGPPDVHHQLRARAVRRPPRNPMHERVGSELRHDRDGIVHNDVPRRRALQHRPRTPRATAAPRSSPGSGNATQPPITSRPVDHGDMSGQCVGPPPLLLTTTEVCRQLRWSPSKLNYIEKAKWIEPTDEAVDHLCELYGVEGRDQDALIELARAARQRGWWTRYDDVFRNEYPGFEIAASVIRTYQYVLARPTARTVVLRGVAADRGHRGPGQDQATHGGTPHAAGDPRQAAGPVPPGSCHRRERTRQDRGHHHP